LLELDDDDAILAQEWHWQSKKILQHKMPRSINNNKYRWQLKNSNWSRQNRRLNVPINCACAER